MISVPFTRASPPSQACSDHDTQFGPSSDDGVPRNRCQTTEEQISYQLNTSPISDSECGAGTAEIDREDIFAPYQIASPQRRRPIVEGDEKEELSMDVPRSPCKCKIRGLGKKT